MHLRSVLGRDAARVGAFVTHWSRPGEPPPRAVADLDALLGDASIDAIYIATRHSSHAAFIRDCLLAGKPVLCEKPLVPNQVVARELLALSQQRQVFLMLALWTRFLPIYAQLRSWLVACAVGRVQAIQSSFCLRVPYDPTSRLFNPALAGAEACSTSASTTLR